MVTMADSSIAWRQLSPYGIVSTCEHYRIAKAIVNGTAVYSLFDGFNLVGRYPTASDAKTACEGQEKAASG